MNYATSVIILNGAPQTTNQILSCHARRRLCPSVGTKGEEDKGFVMIIHLNPSGLVAVLVGFWILLMQCTASAEGAVVRTQCVRNVGTLIQLCTPILYLCAGRHQENKMLNRTRLTLKSIKSGTINCIRFNGSTTNLAFDVICPSFVEPVPL
jgi:hypothetical protein